MPLSPVPSSGPPKRPGSTGSGKSSQGDSGQGSSMEGTPDGSPQGSRRVSTANAAELEAQLAQFGGMKRHGAMRESGSVPSESSTKFREAVSKNKVQIDGITYDLATREGQRAVLDELTGEGVYSLADAVEVSQDEDSAYADLIEVVGEAIRTCFTLKPGIYDGLDPDDDPLEEFFYEAGERAIQFEMLKDKLERDKPLSKDDMSFL